MSFPRYPKYKDSGVDWLGEVPEHWRVVSVRRVVRRIEQGWSPDCFSRPAEPEEWGVVKSGCVNRGVFVEQENKALPETLEPITEYEIKRGDVLMSRASGSRDLVGSTAYIAATRPKLMLSDKIFRIHPDPGIDKKFFVNVFNSLVTRSQIECAISGAEGLANNLPQSAIKGFFCVVPPLVEQTHISAFLDRETAKIDELVAEQQRLMELLKEKRQAVISHAVTKGLNPHAPMKPSGIEWLDDVPEHWSIERGRFLFQKLDISPEPEDGVVTAFRDGQVTLRENRRTEGFTFAVLEVGYQRVRAGDLVIHGMDAFAGAIGVSESTGKCTPEYSVMTPARLGIDSAYFAVILRLMAQRNFVFVICPSVRERAPRFRFESFKDVLLPVPPIKEQVEIMRLIESVEKETRSLTAEAQRAIDLLQERRTALISAAVTGQIDVRSFAERQSA